MIRVLAWDAPNMDMVLTNLLKDKPTPDQRPDLADLQQWFRGRCQPDEECEAAVFVNVPAHLADRLTTWALWLTQTGYRVFAKPKVGGSDIDDDMVAYITSRPPHEVAEIVLASHDAKAFLTVAEELVDAGVSVVVLGFHEFAGGLANSDKLSFVDVSDVPNLFKDLPPRVRLDDLPAEGRWLEPTAGLTETEVEPLAAE
jgi:uncharacterized protein